MRVKWLGRAADHLPPTGAEAKKKRKRGFLQCVPKVMMGVSNDYTIGMKMNGVQSKSCTVFIFIPIHT